MTPFYHYYGVMPRYTVRFPADLYDQITEAATQDTRSIHGEILWLIKAGLNARSTSRSEPDTPLA
jgi:Arc-like DNA binding domain.